MKIPVSGMGEKSANTDYPPLESPEVNETDPVPESDKDKDNSTSLVDDVFEPETLYDQSEQDVDYEQDTIRPTLELDDTDASKPVPPPRSDSHRVRHMIDSISMDEEEEHFYWSKQTEYLLACIGFVNGLGSLLRFTTLTVKHGGGIFFVAYVLLMVLCGCPLVYLETALGQYANGGPVAAWAVVPLFQGLGYSMLIITFLISSYYIVEVTWAMYYFGLSLFSVIAGYPMSWTCPNNTDNIYCTSPPVSNFTKFYLISNKSLPHSPSMVHCKTDSNTVYDTRGNCTSLHSSSVLVGLRYFYEEVLNVSQSIESYGQPQWYMVLCLLLAWVLVFCCLLYGPKSIGKVMYFTAPYPYLILPILFVLCCLMDGSIEGVKFFLNPRWQKLGKLQIWTDAAWLMVYSLGLGTGCLSTLAGYTHFHSHCFRNLLMICLANTLGMMVAGFTMCAGLGVYAADINTTLHSLSLTEYDLGFAIFPYILSRMIQPTVFTILYFLAVIIVGMDSLLVYIQNIVGGVLEVAEKWEIRCSRQRRWTVQLVLCLILFCIGLLFTTRGGLFISDYVSQYVGRIALFVIVVMECCILMYIFGAHKFTNNIADMTGNKDSPWWHWNWKFITPCILSGFVLLSLIGSKGADYKGESYPPWSEILGWFIMLVPLLCIPVSMVICLLQGHGSLEQRIKRLLYTPQFWGRGLVTSQDHSNSAPDYVICHPDNHRPAHGLAMLTANLYIPNLTSLEAEGQPESTSEMTGGYLSDLMTITSTDSIESDAENKDRGNWRGKVEFVLSCLGYIIGLGNIWRFPYLVYRNGGGAFFIPYLVMLLFCGLPLVYMEMAFGQYASLGPITIWRAVPLFKGVGCAMVLSSAVVAVYYNMVNAWAFHYLFNSFFTTLPWSTCNNEWNTENCKENQFQITDCSWINSTKLLHLPSDLINNSSCPDLLMSCATIDSNTTEKFRLENVTKCMSWVEGILGDNINLPGKKMSLSFTSPSYEYFYHGVLQQSSGLQELGAVQWPLALYLLLCWFIVFLCLVKGIYSAGKVAYFVVITPILILLVLLVCAMMVDGHLAGIKFYVTPKWEKVLEPRVWSDAATQVFFSLSACLGGLTTLSSYNKFKSNIYRDAILVCLVDTLMSVLAGFTVFASLGILSVQLNTTVDNVVTTNIGLVFVAIPAAVTHFQPSSMWSVFFFLMIILMGMSTIMTMTETIVTAIIDENVRLLRKWRILVLTFTCSILFLLGLPLTTQGGRYVLQVLDEFCGGIPPIVIGIFMCLALAWIYGVQRFCKDIRRMINRPVSWWWKVMWCVVTPLIIVFILVSAVLAGIELVPEHFPSWAEGFGIFLAILPLSTIPLFAIKKIYSAEGTIVERIRALCQPGKDWGPALEKHWHNVEYYPAVNTHTLSVDIEQSPVHTVSDHIDFTTSGVKAPTLSQASLIPPSIQMSPKKPQDIRQKAILNHAYSNPQCSVSNVSIDKLPKSLPVLESIPHQSDVMIVSKKFNNTEMKNVSTQTDANSYIRSLWRAKLLASSRTLGAHTGTIPRDRKQRNSMTIIQRTSQSNSNLDICDAQRSNSITVLQRSGGSNMDDRLRLFSSDLSNATSGVGIVNNTEFGANSSGLIHRNYLRHSLKVTGRARKKSDDIECRKRTMSNSKRALSRQNSDPYETLGAHGGVPAEFEIDRSWHDTETNCVDDVFPQSLDVRGCDMDGSRVRNKRLSDTQKSSSWERDEGCAQVLQVLQDGLVHRNSDDMQESHSDTSSIQVAVTQF